LAEGAKVQSFDPEARENVKRLYGLEKNLMLVENEYDALKDADALIIATEWAEFRSPDFNKVKSLLKKPVVFDGRNIYDTEYMRSQGFEFQSIGRGSK
jgi:UDPglucose 6-dehydrogenase